MSSKKQNGIVRRVALIVGIIIAIGGVVVGFIKTQSFPMARGTALEVKVEHNEDGITELKALVRDEIPELIKETKALTKEIRASREDPE